MNGRENFELSITEIFLLENLEYKFLQDGVRSLNGEIDFGNLKKGQPVEEKQVGKKEEYVRHLAYVHENIVTLANQ